jgi:hypothetical protein
MLKGIATGKASKSSAGLLVFVLILGGVGAQASGVLNSPSGGYLLCVAPKSSIVTHPSTAKCPAGSEKLILGAEGQAGATGLTGATGLPGKDGVDGKDGKTLWNGVKDPESTWGAPGDMFINSVTKTLFGPKDLTTGWPAGVSMVGPMGARGPQGPEGPGGSGPAGPQGPAGAAGANGASGIAITQLSICGASGTSLCKVGEQGPGGGIIFFVDYNDIYPTFNYLEAAPISCESASKAWSSGNTNVTAARGWAGRAVGAGQTNSTAIKAVFTGDTSANNAAYFATSCSAGGKSDWFLGSLGEMKLMYDNLQGVGGFSEANPCYYWSSTEITTNSALYQNFNTGYQSNFGKGATFYVRPIRSF